MSRSVYDWLYSNRLSSRSKLMLVFVVAILIVAALVGGFWYHVHSKEVAKAEQMARQQAALQQKKASITTFYTNTFVGADVERFLQLYNEILRSRLPIELAGFAEDNFSCTTTSCNFSYKSGASTIFSIQKKLFRGEAYDPAFSEGTVEYTNIPSQLDSNPLLEAFKKHEAINQPECNELLNYLYSYNSLVDPGLRFKLVALPSSSVIDTEKSLPGNPENYGLMAGKWQVSLPDNPVRVLSFWQDRPYSSSFLFQSVASKQGTLDLSGAFLCKK